MASANSVFLVAAFDFGTTYSGYAFSFRTDPLKVITNQCWVAGSARLLSMKTPTCLLMTPQEEFHSFGFEAEEKYTRLAEDGEHRGWRFFRRFKMILHNKKDLSKDTMLEDINDTPMQALRVFSLSIHYLWQHFLRAIKLQAPFLEETDVQYVITVPAIWNDRAKQFMREAAEQAGLDRTRVTLALEPEAASLWCQIGTSEGHMALAGEGTRYMVIDIGGGTADITVHEKQANGKLNEVHKASGGPWGGIFVDQNYMQMLEKIFGEKAIECLKTKHMNEYLDVIQEWETKKRDFRAKTAETRFKISAVLREHCKGFMKPSLQKRIEKAGYGRCVFLKGNDTLKVLPCVIESWFDGPVGSLISHVQGILLKAKMATVNTIILVGGFAECPYVQERIQKEFSNKKVIVPDECGLAVLKGAVRFGHDPRVIGRRIMPSTYGIAATELYDQALHSSRFMYEKHGKQWVDNAFSVFVRVNDEINLGHEITKAFLPNKDRQNSCVIEVFHSSNTDPVFVNDPGCEKLGDLHVQHSTGIMNPNEVINVTFIFGDTELKVKVRLLDTGEEFFLTINCLGENTGTTSSSLLYQKQSGAYYDL